MKWLMFFWLLLASSGPAMADNKLKIGVAGLTHTHVHWVFNSEERGDFEIVGIVEPDKSLARRYASQHDYSMDKVYPTLEAMIDATQPEAITAFGSIFEHLEVVEVAAPRGIHVMVEKPLAVNMTHAQKMYDLAKQHKIHLLTNYETTWYPTNHAVKAALQSGDIGEMRKVLVQDGHKGPSKLGINQEFLDWLLDPVQNGGGAIMDFACYGANLLTWLTDGQVPKTVTAVTQQLQPENNPEVDDEATLILTYPHAQAVVQGSWNWPIGRKDMEVYGTTGVLYADNRHQYRKRLARGYDDFDETRKKLEERPYPYDDPFSYFKAVIEQTIEPEPYALSSLENNMIVMQILDAARQSAASGERVTLPTDTGQNKEMGLNRDVD
ncbi:MULTISPECIES: Gfo/Idh/MocA family protein [unclassified Marinimicrobium]|jgi:predicted dehydrogenase|uniref:Gfo/Idh/MocA family protein n=1 Tax=unclassified Marinimicrobium TaxID=2632100 RepID=UPI000C387A1B|nr:MULTISPECIES: Gfo/Idh/MocA family oxidoreductase [unclassified Marinimicrobium]MAN51170.1 oxidoreductase [Marinimicrobium sp.]|tara:strand:- start:651 stop:1793 length:1143 start_codon:yes stop_codon:yes gene_type:complete